MTSINAATVRINYKTQGDSVFVNECQCVHVNMYAHMRLDEFMCITSAAFCKSHLSSHASRLLAAAIRSTTEVRKSLGSLRVALPS